MLRLLLTIPALFLWLLAKEGDEEKDGDGDGEEEKSDEEKDGDGDGDGDGEEEKSDEEKDGDALTDKERETLNEEIRRLGREQARLKRAAKSGVKPKPRGRTDEERTAYIAIKEALVDAGIPSKAAMLLDLRTVEMDGDDLAAPDDVVDEVRDLLADLGATSSKSDEDDDKPRTQRRRSTRKVPKDKTKRKPKPTGDSMEDKLIAQAFGDS